MTVTASWRGVPFAPLELNARFGRRQAIHEYVKKDVPWVEDMGRRTRRLDIGGFLIADSLGYGGGDLDAQFERMIAACEQTGAGTLLHPDYGELTVNLDLVTTKRTLQGGVNIVELRFSFIETGIRQFPSAAANTAALVDSASAALASASGATFDGAGFAVVTANETALGHASAVLGAYIDQVATLASSGTSALRQCALLNGDFGRYVGGRNIGFLARTPLVTLFASYADLVKAAAGLRAEVDIAASQVVDGLGALGVDVDGVAFAGLVGNHVSALASAAADPRDRVDQIASMFDFDPASAVAVYDAGAQIRDLYRTGLCMALASAGAVYQPASYDDAQATRAAITARLDAHARVVADYGWDDLFSALRALKRAVVADFQARGDTLSPLVELDLAGPVPADRLAMMLYGDATRADELVTEADPVHPLFMPTRFRALAE